MLKTTTRLANHECLTFFALGKKDIFLKSLCKSQKKPITRLWLSACRFCLKKMDIFVAQYRLMAVI